MVALGFFSIAVVVVVVQEPAGEALGAGRIPVEDGAKLLGIAGWFGYFCREAFRSSTALASSEPTRAAADHR